MRICSVSGCAGKHYGKGFCRKHYLRVRVHGDSAADLRASQRPLAERFWEKVDRSGDCWTWTAYRNPAGYGEISLGGRLGAALAHRIAYELTLHPVPGDLHVLHRCDNPACVRPDHLFLGTHLDNMRDMTAKGRGRQVAAGRRGEDNGNVRITDAQVAEIRNRIAAGDSQAAIARAFNVSKTLIHLIKHGKTRARPTEKRA